jgi:hypothetical protein
VAAASGGGLVIDLYTISLPIYRNLINVIVEATMKEFTSNNADIVVYFVFIWSDQLEKEILF